MLGENQNKSAMGDKLTEVEDQEKTREIEVSDQIKEDQYNQNGAGPTNISVAAMQDNPTEVDMEIENLGADLGADLPGFQAVSSLIPKRMDNQKHVFWGD